MRTRKFDTKSTSKESKKTHDLNIKWHCDHVHWQFTNRRMLSTRFLLTTLTTVHSYRFTWLSMYSWLSGPPHLMRLPILNHGRKAGPVNQRSRMSEFFTPSWRKTCKLEYMTGMLQNCTVRLPTVFRYIEGTTPKINLFQFLCMASRTNILTIIPDWSYIACLLCKNANFIRNLILHAPFNITSRLARNVGIIISTNLSDSFINSFVRPSVRPFVRSFVRSFVR